MKKALFFVLTVFMAVSVAGCSAGSTSNSTTPAATSKASSTTSVSSTKAPTSSLSKPFVLSVNSVKDALKKANIQNVADVKLANGTVTVIVYDKNALTINTYVEMNQPNSADTFKCVFGLDKSIKKVVYQSDVPVTDSYGKESKVTGQTNTMERKDYEKVANWDTFKCESPAQYYDVVNFELAPESQVSGIHKAWAKYYNK